MASLHLLPRSPLFRYPHSHSLLHRPNKPFIPNAPTTHKFHPFSDLPFAGTRSAPLISAVSGGDVSSGGNGGAESPKPTRRGRKKSASASSTPPSSSSGKKTKRASKTVAENGAVAVEAERAGARALEEEDEGGDDWDYDDGIDSYDDPPLVCCFGAAQREFVPTVRVHHNPMHPDIYSQWKMLQWDPPEFARAPGGPPSNVAISKRARIASKVSKQLSDACYRVEKPKGYRVATTKIAKLIGSR